MLLGLLITQFVAAQSPYTITNPDQLEGLSLVAGDVVILANGTYSTDERITFSGTGTANAPIIFKAETPGGVVFTGGMAMNIVGDHLVVDGFHWKGGYGASNFIQFRSGSVYANHSTIQNCVIDGLGIEPDDLIDAQDPANPGFYTSVPKHRWVVLYGTYNNVVNCTFLNKKSAGALVLAELEYNASPDGVQNTRCLEVGHTIKNNYFYNFEKIVDNWGTKFDGSELSNAGDSETIRIGTSEFQNVNANCVISGNYFYKADGENEIITNKSNGNIYENNTFRSCRGSLVMRHGSEATVQENFFMGENTEGTGAIRIVDSKHVITNNYIQDCINTMAQAKWNNGITFLGGNDSADVACGSTSVSNGYQKTTAINVSNNTIVNTNAPLFYNLDKGSTDPTGTVSNNLIYFDSGNANITEVISGDTSSSFTNLGTALTYSGNEFVGTTLGASTSGFDENTGITATPSGEIFTFSGTTGKGADMKGALPFSHSNVGNDGVGACFVDYLGAAISNPTCNEIIVTPGEYLSVGTVSTLAYTAGIYDVSVSANVSWEVTSINGTWISNVSPSFSTGNETVSFTVSENSGTTSRSGSITFTQTSGADNKVVVLNITQDAPDLTDLLNLINSGANGAPVTVDSYSRQQDQSHPNPKNNVATNSLDKDSGTSWVADDLQTDGEYVIYDLGGAYTLDLIEIATDSKSNPYAFQVWVSTTDTQAGSFTKILPVSDNYFYTTANSTDFTQFALNQEKARYVKVVGFGRFKDTTNGAEVRDSQWMNIAEINFYGEATTLSTNEFDSNAISLYPIPVKEVLHIKTNDISVDAVHIYSLEGRLVLTQNFTNATSGISINTSRLPQGTYIVRMTNQAHGLNTSKMIVVAP
ncbi:chondroitinase-B domain-containing protein [Pseudotamlana carrageenivorans]|nr:chondroitinase-B domain-containing protein [Tamlana carrageenivorans]